eukprot:g8250.t1
MDQRNTTSSVTYSTVDNLGGPNVSKFLSRKIKEGRWFPEGTHFERHRALKAFYHQRHHHRPSAPAEINFFVDTFEPELTLQSSQSILAGFAEPELATNRSSVQMSHSVCHQIQEDVPMELQTSRNSRALFKREGGREKKRPERARARPMSFHAMDFDLRRMFSSMDWTQMVPRIVRKNEEKTSSSNNTRIPNAKCFSCCTVNSPKQEGDEINSNCLVDCPHVEQDTCPVHSTVGLHFDEVDSDFLETTDDEDNIFHAPFALNCIGAMMIGMPGSERSIIPSDLTTASLPKRLAFSSRTLNRIPFTPGDHHDKKETTGNRQPWSFFTKIASKLCKSPLVKDE